MKRSLLTLFLVAISIASYAQAERKQDDIQPYYFDHTADCESEGFIRFRSGTTSQTGILSKHGEIAVPADYSDLTRVQNGLIFALKGATKIVSEDGEHYYWEGGEVMLIDTNNQILARNLADDHELNLYSVQITDLPSSDPTRYNMEAVNGQYYSFVDFDREFKAWLKTKLLPDFSKETLLQIAHPKITFWTEEDGWVSEDQLSFIERDFDYIQRRLIELGKEATRYEIFTEDLNRVTFNSQEFEKYFNSCGEPKTWLYPVKVIVISRESEDDMQQDHFGFLRTDEGYKLISITLRPEI